MSQPLYSELSSDLPSSQSAFLIVYDCATATFTYPAHLGEQLPAVFDARPLWQIFADSGLLSPNKAKQFRDTFLTVAASTTPQACYAEYCLHTKPNRCEHYAVGFLCTTPGVTVHLTLMQMDARFHATQLHLPTDETDELTGLFTGRVFCRTVDDLMQTDPTGVAAGEYAMLYFDIQHFKMVNDIFGMAEGDSLLLHIANTLRQNAALGDVICRATSDRFILFTHTAGQALEQLIERLLEQITAYNLPFEIICNVGIYVTEGELSAQAMIDRAVLALSQIRGNYLKRYKFYTESLRNALLTEQEITGSMVAALEAGQFLCYYQPQYDHSTGMLVGAEALVRWKHPERGLISPGVFIPIFEKNGFITKLDFYVFEQACRFLSYCKAHNLPLVPVSTNFSRNDIFQPDFVEQLEAIRAKYDLSANLLRVEITESSMMSNVHYVNEVLNQLHEHGYLVEMDDFGSGYSSLNVLKDIEFDIVKLDMLFLSERSGNNRGGTILSSVVRMAKWLGIPIIAEGVETVEQADFLRSIGCNYIQGYLYSKPLPEEAYKTLLSGSSIGGIVPQMNLIDTLNAGNFWSPTSQETLIFSNYVGGAAIFEYHNETIEILRVNTKYLQELCMNLTEQELIRLDPLTLFDAENLAVYQAALERAIETGEEQECDTWRTITSPCCGNERICIRSNLRMIGESNGNYLFYAMIRNITTEKEYYAKILNNERRFKVASEQINIYYWEYTIATHEMRPCFRCMRDLGLPPLMTNYPESAIEAGVFPPEVADQYRDWHRQLAAGVPELEGILPLTADRIPFRVRYTTEFDAAGNPVKAYGSAALIV